MSTTFARTPLEFLQRCDVSQKTICFWRLKLTIQFQCNMTYWNVIQKHYKQRFARTKALIFSLHMHVVSILRCKLPCTRMKEIMAFENYPPEFDSQSEWRNPAACDAVPSPTLLWNSPERHKCSLQICPFHIQIQSATQQKPISSKWTILDAPQVGSFFSLRNS